MRLEPAACVAVVVLVGLLGARSGVAAPVAPPPVAVAGAPSGDVVEVLDDVEPAAPASAEPATAVATDAPARCDGGGWASQRGRLGLLDVDWPSAAPYDRASLETSLFARLRCARRRSLELLISGRLELDYFGASRRGTLAGDLTRLRTRQRYEATLGELYAGYSRGPVDVTVGQQRVAWGRSDLIESPNDVLNAHDLRRSPLSDPALRQLPTPLLRAGVDLEPLRFEATLAPLFVPDRFDLYGSNWALLQPVAPSGLLGLFRMADRMLDRSRLDDFNRLSQQTRLPGPGQVSAGARLSASIGNVDLDGYYHFGFDRTPRVVIDPVFGALLDQVDFERAKPSDLGPFFDAMQTSHPPLRVEYERRHHCGADVATVIGPIALRLDAGYDSKRTSFGRDLRGVPSRAIQAVGSVEYQTGNLDTLIELEMSALHLFDVAGRDLLFVRSTSLTLAGVIRAPVVRSLIAGVRALLSPRPRSLLVAPELTWRADDDWSLALAALYLDGERRGLGGYFSRNVEAEMSVRYSF